MTLEQIINRGARRFQRAGLWFGHGTDNAWDEAAWLAAHTMELPLPLGEQELRIVPTMAQQRRIDELFTQRVETRQPAAYLTNEAWFCGLAFYVDQRVLVPRSPLAELIADRFVPWIEPENVNTVLDIGTGSGCIAIAVARFLPDVRVLATDISSDALAVAAVNIARHHVADRVTLLKSDLFESIEHGRRFDIIVSNPPYVSTARCAELPDEYQHEPRLGLASGEWGLDHAGPIIERAADHLTPGGVLILEVGESRAALEQRYPNLPINWLEFAHGGEGVALIRAGDLQQYASG